ASAAGHKPPASTEFCFQQARRFGRCPPLGPDFSVAPLCPAPEAGVWREPPLPRTTRSAGLPLAVLAGEDSHSGLQEPRTVNIGSSQSPGVAENCTGGASRYSSPNGVWRGMVSGAGK